MADNWPSGAEMLAKIRDNTPEGFSWRVVIDEDSYCHYLRVTLVQDTKPHWWNFRLKVGDWYVVDRNDTDEQFIQDTLRLAYKVVVKIQNDKAYAARDFDALAERLTKLLNTGGDENNDSTNPA